MTDSELQNIKQRHNIIGNSPNLLNAIRKAVLVAPTDMSVLITGENGVGKESFSRIIHERSPRKHAQFIAINCGAIPEGTIYSELFGHEKGAFTGATDVRKGYFEVADGGTIFLDEIGELPPQAQVMLLRVLEAGEFIRMGSSKVLKTNVRVVGATNVNLDKAMEENKFREDLFHRLSTVPIFVPPLRERGEDILLLFRKFTYDFSEKYNIPMLQLSEDAKETLLKYRFSGNVRQLKNLADQISLLEGENRYINADTLLKYLPKPLNSNNSLVKLDNSDNNFQNISDREILFKIMFDMKRDMTELKKLFFQIIQNGELSKDSMQFYKEFLHEITAEFPLQNMEKNDFMYNNTSISEANVIPIQNNSLTPTINHQNFLPMKTEKTENFEKINEKLNNTVHSANIHEELQIQDISHEIQNDILSIEAKEKELILKALKKNKNKRKSAAIDLGISERTLYRKIKEYDILGTK